MVPSIIAEMRGVGCCILGVRTHVVVYLDREFHEIFKLGLYAARKSSNSGKA
jgi:hypothetical protein